MLLQKRERVNYAITIHVTAMEDQFLRTVKDQTGVSCSEQIRQRWLTRATKLFFSKQGKKKSRKQAAMAVQPAVQ